MGICLKGVWTIDNNANPYSDHFRSGTKGIIIARAATTLSKIHYRQVRVSALSGKIFPTTKIDAKEKMSAANFLLMKIILVDAGLIILKLI